MITGLVEQNVAVVAEPPSAALFQWYLTREPGLVPLAFLLQLFQNKTLDVSGTGSLLDAG